MAVGLIVAAIVVSIGIGIVFSGIPLDLLAIWATSTPAATATPAQPTATAVPENASEPEEQPGPTPTAEGSDAGSGTAGLPSGSSATVQALQTPLPTIVPEPMVLPDLPVVVPEDGRTLLLIPDEQAIGWLSEGDPNRVHLGDYSIFAGILGGSRYISVFEFDLSSIDPGSVLLYADLTLTGLADERLGDGGTWQVDILAPWTDGTWQEGDFEALSRPENGALTLSPRMTASVLDVDQMHTFLFSPGALGMLAERASGGTCVFRVMGPDSGPDNLFAWHGGYGGGSGEEAPVLRVVIGPPAATSQASP
jgi:hypothetical protein